MLQNTGHNATFIDLREQTGQIAIVINNHFPVFEFQMIVWSIIGMMSKLVSRASKMQTELSNSTPSHSTIYLFHHSG